LIVAATGVGVGDGDGDGDGDGVGVVIAMGVTLFEVVDTSPVPTLFVAVTAKVYATPLVNPVIVIGLDVPFAV
jgi:hypothetical protein